MTGVTGEVQAEIGALTPDGAWWAVEAEPARAGEIIAGRVAMLRANMEFTLDRIAELAVGPPTVHG